MPNEACHCDWFAAAGLRHGFGSGARTPTTLNLTPAGAFQPDANTLYWICICSLAPLPAYLIGRNSSPAPSQGVPEPSTLFLTTAALTLLLLRR